MKPCSSTKALTKDKPAPSESDGDTHPGPKLCRLTRFLSTDPNPLDPDSGKLNPWAKYDDDGEASGRESDLSRKLRYKYFQNRSVGAVFKMISTDPAQKKLFDETMNNYIAEVRKAESKIPTQCNPAYWILAPGATPVLLQETESLAATFDVLLQEAEMLEHAEDQQRAMDTTLMLSSSLVLPVPAPDKFLTMSGAELHQNWKMRCAKTLPLPGASHQAG